MGDKDVRAELKAWREFARRTYLFAGRLFEQASEGTKPDREMMIKWLELYRELIDNPHLRWPESRKDEWPEEKVEAFARTIDFLIVQKIIGSRTAGYRLLSAIRLREKLGRDPTVDEIEDEIENLKKAEARWHLKSWSGSLHLASMPDPRDVRRSPDETPDPEIEALLRRWGWLGEN